MSTIWNVGDTITMQFKQKPNQMQQNIQSAACGKECRVRSMQEILSAVQVGTFMK